MNKHILLILLCASTAIPVLCQTTIGSPSSVGSVTDQASGSHRTRAQLIDRDVEKLKKFPPKIQQLLDPQVSTGDIEAAYKDFRTTGQRLSPLDFLAEAKAIRTLTPQQINDLSGKSSIVALSLGSHGLLPVRDLLKAAPATAPSGKENASRLDEQVKMAKKQLESAIKNQ